MTSASRTDRAETSEVRSGSLRGPALPLGIRLFPLLAVLLLGPLALLRPVNDPDTWWHLRSGEDLQRTFVLVGADPWSPFTSNTWVRHQWLSEILMHRLWASAGLPGLAAAVAIGAGVIVATTYLVLRRNHPVVISSIVAVVAVLGTTVSLTARPQVLSFPLTVVAAAAWWRASVDGRARWWLVPLTFAWACLHGFWIIVPIVGALTALGMTLERRPRADILRQVAVTTTCVLAAAVTPVGPRLLLSGLEVSAITGFIQEWLPAPAGTPAFLAVAAMLILAAALWSWGAGPTWPEVLLLALAAYLAVSHGRTTALAAMIAAPLVASSLSSRLPHSDGRPGRREVMAVLTALVVGAGTAAAIAPLRASQPVGFPTALSARLDALPDGTVVCNQYWVGGWLLWAHPDLLPVIDGRTELYTVDALQDYVTMSTGGSGWQEVVRARGCSAALVEADSPLGKRLTAEGWRPARDGRWELLTAP